MKSSNPSIYAALRMNKDETLLVVINLSDKPLTDYTLALEDAVLKDGTYGMETELGDASGQDPEVTDGVFKNYKPIDKLNPFSTLIVKLQP